MAPWSFIVNLWRSIWWDAAQDDDLQRSEKLLRHLNLPPSSSSFIIALPVPGAPDPSTTVYILAAGNLSERSVSDTRTVVNSINPGAVLAQVDAGLLADLHEEERILASDDISYVPTSLLGVLKDCFSNKFKSEDYEKLASFHVLNILFGTSYHGNALAAKAAAEEIHSLFRYLVAPHKVKDEEEENVDLTVSGGNMTSPLRWGVGHGFLNPQQTHLAPSYSAAMWKRGLLDLRDIKTLDSSYLTAFAQELSQGMATQLPYSSAPPKLSIMPEFHCPSYADSFFSLLCALHELYKDETVFESTQRLLLDVQDGRKIDPHDLARAYRFRFLLESLRVVLNKSARQVQEPVQSIDFDQLSYKDKCHVLLAKALQQQAMQSRTVVAIIDAASVAGIRKYWNAPVSSEVNALASECFVYGESEENDRKDGSTGRLKEKPVVVVGAGAAAVVGLASLSHVTSASTVMKVIFFKVPAVVKIGMLQAKKSVIMAASRAVTPIFKPLLVSAKAVFPIPKVLISLKTALTTGKSKATAHSIVATAQRVSISAIRTSFYSVMRKHQGKHAGARPWVVFGASVLAGAGIIMNGNRIERTVEALPRALSLAQLGQGLKNLQQAAAELRQIETSEEWDRIHSRLYFGTQRKA